MGLEAALARAHTGDRPRTDVAAGTLAGSRCARCAATAWPGRAVCHRCGSADVYDCAFADHGTLLSYTRVMVPRPGLESPYVLGQVRIADGPIVFGTVTGLAAAASVPCPVRVRVAPDRYWFETIDE